MIVMSQSFAPHFVHLSRRLSTVRSAYPRQRSCDVAQARLVRAHAPLRCPGEKHRPGQWIARVGRANNPIAAIGSGVRLAHFPCLIDLRAFIGQQTGQTEGASSDPLPFRRSVGISYNPLTLSQNWNDISLI
jgi:hypothetical protein